MCIQKDHRQIMVKTISTKKTDAFSKYSNDITRLRTLSHHSTDDNESFIQSFVTKHYVSPNLRMKLSADAAAPIIHNGSASTEGQVRKTRISYELHPSLILDDMLEDLWTTAAVGESGASTQEVDDEDVNDDREDLASLLEAFRNLEDTNEDDPKCVISYWKK